MISERKQILLHIGTRKSGTTFLQVGYRSSAEALARQGLAFTYQPRPTQMRDWVMPMRVIRDGGDPARLQRSVAAYVAEVRASDLPRHAISLEDFAEYPAEVIAVLADGLAGADLDVRVVLTARHWGRTVPSEWQQNVKERSTTSLDDFLAAIRDAQPEADLFYARHDLAAIVRRWRAAMPQARVDLVVVPPSGSSTSLVDVFSAVMGIDPATLSMPSGGVNESLSLAQAELLRRINVSLGERLPGEQYHQGVRGWVTRGSLMAHARTPIALPDAFVGWAREQMELQRTALSEIDGVQVHGDLGDLAIGSAYPVGSTMPSEAEIAEVAALTIADLAVARWAEHADATAVVAERDAWRLRAESGLAGLARRAVGRARRWRR